MPKAILNSGGAVAYQDAGAVAKENPISSVLTGDAVALTTATAKTFASIVLQPGVYDVTVNAHFKLAGATTTKLETSLSDTTDTMGAAVVDGGIGTEAYTQQVVATTTATQENDQRCGPVRVSLTETTTLYAVLKATFSAGAITAYGSISATRLN
jgi:hypothetical protein